MTEEKKQKEEMKKILDACCGSKTHWLVFMKE